MVNALDIFLLLDVERYGVLNKEQVLSLNQVEALNKKEYNYKEIFDSFNKKYLDFDDFLQFMEKIPFIPTKKDKDDYDSAKRFRYELYKNKSKCTGRFRKIFFKMRSSMVTGRV